MTASTTFQGPLPQGVRSRMIQGVNGLDVHVLEAGHESPGRPLALLLHGFPDLAYGWRHLMPLLADAGYHVVAPDQRGFGRTTGWLAAYDTPLEPFGFLNLTRDALADQLRRDGHGVSNARASLLARALQEQPSGEAEVGEVA